MHLKIIFGRFPLSIEHDFSAPMTVESLSKLRINVLNRVYIVFLIIGGIVLAVASIDPVSKGNWFLFIGYIITYLLVVLAYLIKKIPYTIRTLVILLGLIAIGISELWFFGFGSLGYLYLFASIILACWLVGTYLGVILLAISFIFSGIIAAFYSYGNLDMSSPQRQIADDLIDWLAPFLGFFVISIAFISLFQILIQGLKKNIHANIKYQKEIESSHSELQSNVAMLDAVIESFPEIFYMYDLPPNHLVRYNENHWKMTGYTESEIKKMTIDDWFGDEFSRSKLEDVLGTINKDKSISLELPFKTKDGAEHPWLFTAKAFSHNKKDYFVGFGLDLTEQKELESKFKQVFEESKAGIMLVDRNGIIKDLNNVILETAGLEREHLIGHDVFNFSTESDKERRKELHTDLFEGKIDKIHEEREIILPDGTRKYNDVSVGLVPFSKEGPLAVYVVIEFTKQKEYQTQLETSLKEKGLLLQEVHHRVRNNLQIISSLINISGSYSESIEEFKQAVALRIQAMSLMHERLSEEEGYASVDLESYVYDLISAIYELYTVDINKIKITSIIPEKIVMKIDLASSIGILINEIVSNAVLHAFKGIDKGSISVNIHNIEGLLTIKIEDDGIGMPDNYDKQDSFGFVIVDSLVKQIKGELTVRSGFLADNRGSELILEIPC